MPSPNEVQLEYEVIESTSSQLNNAVMNINPQLLDLKTKVDNLLTNGLFLQQTSPALQTSYKNFTDMLLKMVTQINSFASQFMSIKTTIEQLDEQIAASIKKGG
jgi:chromosome segregation ATPase